MAGPPTDIDALHRAVFDGSPDMLVLWNHRLEVVDVNAAYCELVRLPRERLVGWRLEDRDDAGEMRQFIPLIQAALRGEAANTLRHVTGLQGREWDVEVRYLPLHIGGERYALGVGRDVTNRMERERHTLRSEARLRATVEAAFDCVIGMDGEGRIIEFNKAAERVFGRRRGDVLGQPLAPLLLPPAQREAHERGLRRFHQGGPGRMLGRLVEATAMRADGSEFPVELAISVADDPEGTLFVCHLRDITERKRAEAEHEQLEAQLRQAQKMEAIGQLTGGIAHDFNNILTSVIGYLVLAQERSQPLGDATLQRQLGRAELAATRARDLIAQMLAFARRRGSERRVVALPALVAQTLSLLQSAVPSSLQLQGPEPAAGPPPTVMADPVQLEQLLFNLCINARDAMQGSGRVRLRLRQGPRAAARCASCQGPVAAGEWVVLGVDDEGSGIEPALLGRVFDPFFTTKPAGQGSGMGLAMVHGIVHDHGGHVLVDTAPGRGTRVSVLLPPAAAAADAPAAAAAPRAAPLALQGSVAVVDDERMVGEFLVELLQGWGLRTHRFEDPAAAEQWLRDGQHPLDLLLTDQTMPGLSGLHLAARARTLRPALPVLLMSGDARGFDPAELDRHGVAQALPKPLDTQRLREALGRLLPPAAEAP